MGVLNLYYFLGHYTACSTINNYKGFNNNNSHLSVNNIKCIKKGAQDFSQSPEVDRTDISYFPSKSSRPFYTTNKIDVPNLLSEIQNFNYFSMILIVTTMTTLLQIPMTPCAPILKALIFYIHRPTNR